MRLFVGIPLAEGGIRELAAVVERARDVEVAGQSAALRWATPESWHITLQFLGNTTAQQLECLNVKLAEVREAQFSVQLGELGCFERAGVLFADVLVSPHLTALQRNVIAATSRCGFAAEARPFHPHITLVRTKSRTRGRELRALRDSVRRPPNFTSFLAREFLLYESHLGMGGSKYEVRMRVPLAQHVAGSA